MSIRVTHGDNVTTITTTSPDTPVGLHIFTREGVCTVHNPTRCINTLTLEQQDAINSSTPKDL